MSKGGNSKSRLTRVMVLVFCTSSHSFTFVKNLKKIFQTVFNLQPKHKYMAEIAMFNVERTITPKVSKPALQFISSARCLIELYICVKFH